MAEPAQTPQKQAQVVLPRRLLGKARTATVSSGLDRGARIPRDDRYDANRSVQSRRGANKAATQLRDWYESDGTVSTAIAQFVAMAATRIHFDAYVTGTNEYSREGLQACESVVSSLDTLWNYTKGYQDKRGVQLLAESMLLEVVLTSGVAAELVLSQERLPDNLVLVPYETLEWVSDGSGGKRPVQRPARGEEIDLNIPNFWVAESLKPADRLFSIPIMVSGLKRLIAYEQFVEDMQRVIRQSGQPRLLVKLNYEMVRNSAPHDIAADPDKLVTYINSVRSDMESLLSGLAPEEALVFYDLAEVNSISTAGEKKDYTDLLQELSGLAASAIKSNPSALGLRMGGSQNVASTEAMLTMKLAALFQKPVEMVLSRALTLAVRLHGVDAYVKAKFDDIDLRPKAELEAHRSMQQARILELLSLGRITDDEAQSMLGLGSLPESSEMLSGTRFLESKKADTLPASGTNARNASIMPGTPTSSGGKDNEQRV